MPAHAQDEPLQTINIRHTVYSDTAAELFWDRIPAPADARVDLLYRISVDGVAVPNRLYGISFFSGELIPGQDHEFVIEAVLGRNEIIARGATIINTQRDPAQTAPFPGNLRGTVYSPGVFEIFWDRDPTPLSYEIYQSGGELLATTTGTSYYFNSEPAFDGPTASIDVIAVDQAGNRSGVAFLLLEIGLHGNSATRPEPPVVIPPTVGRPDIFTFEGGIALLEQINLQLTGNPGNLELLERFWQISNEGGSNRIQDDGFIIERLSASSGYNSNSEDSEDWVECPGGNNYKHSMSSMNSGRYQKSSYEMFGCEFDGVRHSGIVISNSDQNSYGSTRIRVG